MKYSDLTFKKKLIYGFSLNLFFFILVMVFYQKNLNSTIKNYRNLLSTTLAVEIKSIEARNLLEKCKGNERDFFLNKKPKSISELRKNIKNLKNITGEILKLSLIQNNVEDSELTQNALKIINNYEISVNENVKANQKKGLSRNEGLLKEFSKAAEDLAEITRQHTYNDFYILFLKLSRAETRYLINNSDTNKKEWQNYTEKFITLLNEAPIWSTAKKALEEYINDYKKNLTIFLRNKGQNSLKAKSYSNLNEASDSIQYLLNNMYLQNGKALLLEIRTNEKDYFLTHNENFKKATLISVQNAIKSLNNSTMDIDFIYEMESYLDDYKKYFMDIVAINKDIAGLNKKMIAITSRLESVYEKLKSNSILKADNFSSSLGKIAAKKAIKTLGIAILTFIATIFSGILITRSITKPLNRAVAIANGIAKGNLEQTFDIKGSGEIGKLAKSLSLMVKNLLDNKKEIELRDNAKSHVLKQIAASSEKIFEGSGELSNFSRSLMQGAVEQNELIEGINISLNEIKSQTDKNASNATEANELVLKSLKAVIIGKDQMTRMLKSMDEINTAGSKIARIIKTIDDLAFQTNILAINAAVEAARAGKHGKGFAVVASEVKNLAEKSTNAVNETAALIRESIKTVENGNKATIENEEIFNKINESVTQTVSLVEEIELQSKAQAEAISRINNNIQLVNTVTKKNSTDAKKTFTSAEYFFSQAESLKKVLSTDDKSIGISPPKLDLKS